MSDSGSGMSASVHSPSASLISSVSGIPMGCHQGILDHALGPRFEQLRVVSTFCVDFAERVVLPRRPKDGFQLGEDEMC